MTKAVSDRGRDRRLWGPISNWSRKSLTKKSFNYREPCLHAKLYLSRVPSNRAYSFVNVTISAING